MNKPTRETAIAFDFGVKNIGVACGQAFIGSAQALQTLRAKEGIPNWHEIDELLQQWKPSYLVVGLPCNMDGSESEMTRRAKKFGNRLHGRFGLVVHFIDERLTSREARDRLYDALSEQGTHRAAAERFERARSDKLDGLAACVILESWWHSRKERDPE